MADQDRDQTGDDNQNTGQQKQHDNVQGGGGGNAGGGGAQKQDTGMTPSTERLHDGGDAAGARSGDVGSGDA